MLWQQIRLRLFVERNQRWILDNMPPRWKIKQRQRFVGAHHALAGVLECIAVLNEEARD